MTMVHARRLKCLIILRYVVLVFASFPGVGIGLAAEIRWDNSDTTNEWTTANNWEFNAEPGSGDTGEISTALGATEGTITVSANRTVGRIQFQGGGNNWLIGNSGGGVLTLDGVSGEIIRFTSGNNNTVGVDITLGADNLRIVAEDNRRGIVTSDIGDAGNNYNLIIQDLNNQNGDVLRIGGNSTYGGNTTVLGGVEIESNQAFSSGTVNWNDGVRDVWKLDDITLENDIIFGTGFNPEVQRSGGSANTLNGDLSGGDASQQFIINVGNSSTLVLGGTNTFENELFLSQNTLQLDGSLSHANMTDDGDASTLTGDGSITWNVSGLVADLMDLDESTVDIDELDLILEGTPLEQSYVIANYTVLDGLAFESITNNTGFDFAIDYGSGATDSIGITFSAVNNQVPEPASVAIWSLIGLGMLTYCRARRRQPC